MNPSETSLSPGKKLRICWEQAPVVIPGVFNPLVARMAEQLGFRAIYLSGGALSAGTGVPDVGLLSLTEFVTDASKITQITQLPLLCDADTGFGDVLNVERTVQLMIRAGVAGIHLEDQEMPKRCGHLSGKSLVAPQAMAAKVKAAAQSRTDKEFVIIARTDARGVNGFDDAVARANLYLEAGADAIFPEALATKEEFAEFSRRVQAPLLANMTEFGKSPLLTQQELADLGYKMVLYPLSAFRVAMRAAETALQAIFRDGHQKNLLPTMQTRAELYDLLQYSDFEARDRHYFE